MQHHHHHDSQPGVKSPRNYYYLVGYCVNAERRQAALRTADADQRAVWIGDQQICDRVAALVLYRLLLKLETSLTGR